MDITPALPDGVLTIDGYSEDNITVNGKSYSNKIILTTNNVIEYKKLNQHFDILADAEIILIITNTTDRAKILAQKNELKLRNINPEFMNKGAACRTYNALLSEGRDVVLVL